MKNKYIPSHHNGVNGSADRVYRCLRQQLPETFADQPKMPLVKIARQRPILKLVK